MAATTPRRPLFSHRTPLLPTIHVTTVLQLPLLIPKPDHKPMMIAPRPRDSSSLGDWDLNARMVMGDYGEDMDEDDDEDEEDEEEDRSLDLLIRFVENVFRKVSRRARKAVKSVLPVPISAKLVGFAVNGTIILTFLWVLKAFLQVICTLGSVVFASILLIRGIWTGISYFQESHNYRLDDDDHRWTGSQPAI